MRYASYAAANAPSTSPNVSPPSAVSRRRDALPMMSCAEAVAVAAVASMRSSRFRDIKNSIVLRPSLRFGTCYDDC